MYQNSRNSRVSTSESDNKFLWEYIECFWVPPDINIMWIWWIIQPAEAIKATQSFIATLLKQSNDKYQIAILLESHLYKQTFEVASSWLNILKLKLSALCSKWGYKLIYSF